MKIAVIGYTGSGKSTAASMLAEIMEVGAADTSAYLIRDYAKYAGISPQHILSNKHKYRDDLFKYARSIQLNDPLYLIKQALSDASIITGIRNPDEIRASRNLFDYIIWIDNPGINAGSTDKLDESYADITVHNIGSTEDLYNILLMLVDSGFKTAF